MEGNPFVNRLVEDHRAIKKVLESVIAPKGDELAVYLGRWQGHERMEEEYIFPVLERAFGVTSPDDAAGVVEAAKRAAKFVEKAEEDHDAFREFMKKYEDALPDALKVRLKAHIELEDMILFPAIRGIAGKG